MKASMIGNAVAMALAWPLSQEADTAKASGGSAGTKLKFCTKEWDPDEFGEKVSFKFSDGPGGQIGTVLELDCSELNESMRTHLMLHGASQKVGDSFAGVKGNFADGIANAKAVIDQLLSGEWTGDREGGGPRLAELAEAIARLKGVDVERARTAVEKATKEERDGWRSNAKVRHAVATIRAEKAAAALEKAGDTEVNISL